MPACRFRAQSAERGGWAWTKAGAALAALVLSVAGAPAWASAAPAQGDSTSRSAPVPDDPWPRTLRLPTATVVVYQPQVDAWDGNRLDFRSTADHPASGGATGAPGGETMSAEELNRQLNNPVSSVWSLAFQHNYAQLNNHLADLPGWDKHHDKWFYTLNFQPVLPLRLTEDWNLINRPVIPVFADRPVFEPSGVDEAGGLGDIALVSLVSPARTTQGLLWGLGPTFIFPTASKRELGQEKWQAGPAAVGLYLGKEWIAGVFPQHWWSFAGDGERKPTSQTNIEYFVQRLFPGQWQVGMAPNITIDWKAEHDNKLTLPVGLGVGKLFRLGKLPVKIVLEGQYAVIHPDDIGQGWNIRLTVTPVLPALLKDPLFGR